MPNNFSLLLFNCCICKFLMYSCVQSKCTQFWFRFELSCTLSTEYIELCSVHIFILLCYLGNICLCINSNTTLVSLFSYLYFPFIPAYPLINRHCLYVFMYSILHLKYKYRSLHIRIWHTVYRIRVPYIQWLYICTYCICRRTLTLQSS